MPKTTPAITGAGTKIQVYSNDVNTIGVYPITIDYVNKYNTSLFTSISFNISIECTPSISYTYNGLT